MAGWFGGGFRFVSVGVVGDLGKLVQLRLLHRLYDFGWGWALRAIWHREQRWSVSYDPETRALRGPTR